MSHPPFPFALSALTAWAVTGGLALAPAVAQAQVPAPPQLVQNGPATPQPFVLNAPKQLNDHSYQFVTPEKQAVTIDFYGPNIFRVFQDSIGRAPHNPVATPPAEILVEQPRKEVGQLTFTAQDRGYVLSTSAISLEIDGLTGAMTITDLRTGKVAARTLGTPKFDAKGVELRLAAADDEYFYGGGVQNGRFSHRGQRIAIENTNNWVDGGVASPTPFYWSTAGYGILWHTFKMGSYDFGAKQAGEVVLRHEDRYLDLFFMVSPQPVALLNDFYQLTGHPVLLPKFGFYQGHLNAYNRDYWTEAKDGKGFMRYEDGKTYNESQKDNGGIRESLNGENNNYQFSARAAVDRYFRNDMPLGWFLPNDGYGAGYGQTNSLDGNIANLKQFGDYARSKGVEIGLWTQSDLHPKDGIEPLLQRDIVKEVRDAGVRVLKTDVAWVGWGYSFGLNGVADVARIMPRYGNDARPFIISLDGWAGTQRYAGIWSGDQTGGEWEYIRFHIPTFIGSGLSGQPNISSDTDGIFGGRNIAVNVREFQWKTFNPMGLNMDGWGANPKYPEVLGGKSVALNRWYLKLKTELMPYIYTAAEEAVKGRPMIRPMFMEETNAYTLGKGTQYQFMFGDAFLVAPIYQNTAADAEGNDRRDGIYLPAGTWIDYFTGTRYRGGRIVNH
ncbi:MAG: alpha-xylosidase, partial [Bacteroidaceae bacterium]|nr:alpha-xylosidase [Bacteroidaceae bacterium]